MVLTESDLRPKTPVKKPKTFNPIGSVLSGFFIAEGFVLLHNSFVSQSINVAYSSLGIILVLLSILAYTASISLTSKRIEFFNQLEKTSELRKRVIVETLLFYIGFTPSFGFFLAYGVKGLELWIYFVVILFTSITFLLLIVYNINQLQKTESRMFHLLQAFYQPKKCFLLLLCSLVLLLSLAFLFIFS